MSAPPPRGPRPTDAELVLFVDGELERPREAEVRAWVAADGALGEVVSTLRLAGRLVEREALARADRFDADSIADSVMARIERDAALDARDRTRRVAFAAMALAAAAAVLVWLPSATAPDRIVRLAAVAPSAQDAVGREPSAPSVEIDAVDFGARAGSIFYVRSGVETTTVVWLSDDDGAEPRRDLP